MPSTNSTSRVTHAPRLVGVEAIEVAGDDGHGNGKSQHTDKSAY